MSRNRLQVASDHNESAVVGRNVVGRLTAAGWHKAALEE